MMAAAVRPAQSVSYSPVEPEDRDYVATQWSHDEVLRPGDRAAEKRTRHSARVAQGWKPQSVRPPVLIAFIVASLGLAGVIEYFAQESTRQGGIGLSNSADDMPAAVTFSYLALPTILAVLYALAWTWIDLDIRRIQPWLELSRSGGAGAESSLLLDYPFEFLAFVPFKAWKQRHWPVFLASTVMMIIFWAITPLQAAIFGTGQVLLTQPANMSTTSVLMPVDQQAAAMDTSLLIRAYASTWLSQPFPAYATAEYALLPFSPLDEDQVSFPNATWTGGATKLATDLTCWPAEMTQGNSPMVHIFDNGRGCRFEFDEFDSSQETTEPITILYIGYWDDAHLDWALQSPNCSLAAANQFLALWALSESPLRNITGLFCETSYTKQNVTISLPANTRQPIENSLIAMEDAVELDDTEFNRTAFEYLIGVGYPPVQIPRDAPDNLVLEQFPVVFNKNLTWPITNMVGFAIGNYNNSSVEGLHDATALGAVFAAAHRQLFSLAVSSLPGPPAHSVPETSGSIQYAQYGVIVSRSFSLAVEALLILVALLTALILVLCHKAKSHLPRDPASMSALFDILADSKPLLDRFVPTDGLDDQGLRDELSGQRYRLVTDGENSQGPRAVLETIVSPAEPDEDGYVGASHPVAGAPSAHDYTPVRPMWLRPFTGITVIVLLLAAIGVIVYFKKQEISLGGLPRPTNNFEVLQLLENYVPLVFASFLEPFFILINRFLCWLQPFHDLRVGHAPARTTIETRYASLPPQLNVVRALKSRHFLLAALCLVSIMMNVLTVAIGALFNEFPVSTDNPTFFQQLHNGSLSRTAIVPYVDPAPFYNHFYVAVANISTSTSLPPWMDLRFAYLPFEAPPTLSDGGSALYQAETRGFGWDPNCSTLTTSPDSPIFVTYSPATNSSTFQLAQFEVSFKSPNGSISNKCGMNNPQPIPPSGASALELFSALTSQVIQLEQGYTTSNNSEFCGQSLVAGWLRSNSANPLANLTMTMVHCRPVLRTAMFRVWVDGKGYVLQSEQAGDFEDVGAFMNQTERVQLTTEVNTLVSLPIAVNSWHNDSLSRDWVNYLLRLSLNSTRLVDPAQPVPSADEANALVGSMYQRLSASLLGLNTSLFDAAPANAPLLAGTFTSTEPRIFMNNLAFFASVVMLFLAAAIAAIVYARERRFYLPRLPSTIGSLIAYVAASRAVRQFGDEAEHAGLKSGSRPTYSFGSFVGVDGKPHVGIERDPYVVPMGKHFLTHKAGTPHR